MEKCFLHGHGPCGGRLTAEHYISKTVLEAVAGTGKAEIGGLPWQPKDTLQSIGIGSLTAKVLCETHNNGLAVLDSAAGRLFRALNAADKDFEKLAELTRVDGPLVERWFLKVLCGLTAGVNINNGVIPSIWCNLLTGGRWPDKWGMYIPIPEGQQVLATELYVHTFVNPDTKELKCALFRVAGVTFYLLLGHPDHPEAWGKYRPRGLIFKNDTREKRVEFVWPFVTNEAVTLTKVGTGGPEVPQWAGWKRQSNDR